MPDRTRPNCPYCYGSGVQLYPNAVTKLRHDCSYCRGKGYMDKEDKDRLREYLKALPPLEGG